MRKWKKAEIGLSAVDKANINSFVSRVCFDADIAMHVEPKFTPQQSFFLYIIFDAWNYIERGKHNKRFRDGDAGHWEREAYREAFNWVSSRSDSWMSFEWYCNQIGINPEYVRKKILKDAEPPRERKVRAPKIVPITKRREEARPCGEVVLRIVAPCLV